MAFDAVILTGGRASRLGGIQKASLVVGGRTLLERALDAAAAARVRVVVGDSAPDLPAGVIVTREEPPYGGPAAALGAGVAALDVHDVAAGLADSNADVDVDTPALVLVLACDMPGVADAVPPLVDAALTAPEADVALLVDADGRRQYLAAVYRRAALTNALRGASLEGMPMRALVEKLRVVEVSLPGDASADIDTWDDARPWGATSRERDDHETESTTTPETTITRSRPL